MMNFDIFGRAFVIWIVIALCEVVHGILRNRFVTPHLGDHRARQLSVLTGSGIIFLISFFTIHWINITLASQAIWIGVMWFFSMLIFELSLGRYVFKFSWKWLLNDFNLLKGKLLLLGMLFLALAPWLTAKLHGLI